jgi:hypothetical protein
MNLPRLTVRWLMLVVAVMGSLSYGLRLWSLNRTFRLQAESHVARKAEARVREAWAAKMAKSGYLSARRVVAEASKAEYHDSLAIKYERAARYPWLPVLPDPPEPE